MVTGHVPFDHENGVTIALMHLQNEITPPSQIRDGIPDSLEKIILKCTMKKPEERYQTADDLIADLRLCTWKSFSGVAWQSKAGNR